MTDDNTRRYTNALHAMQSGVAMEMNYDQGPTEPKHLRVGVNAAMVDHSALCSLLIDKGLITLDEILAANAKGMEAEVKRYEAHLTERLGTNITLG